MGTITIDTAFGLIAIWIESKLARTLISAISRLQTGTLLAAGVRCISALTCRLGALMEEQTYLQKELKLSK